MRVQIEIETGARDIPAEVALRVRLRDYSVQMIDQVAILAADVEITFVRIHRQAGDQNAFDHLKGIVLHQQTILAGAGLALIGVDHDVFGLGRSARDETPLESGGETGAAAATQRGGFHFIHDLLRRHLARLEERLEAVVCQIRVQAV